MRASTSRMRARLTLRISANLVEIPDFLLLGGGVLVKLGNEVIGAVGVGGAPAAISMNNV